MDGVKDVLTNIFFDNPEEIDDKGMNMSGYSKSLKGFIKEGAHKGTSLCVTIYAHTVILI